MMDRIPEQHGYGSSCTLRKVAKHEARWLVNVAVESPSADGWDGI